MICCSLRMFLTRPGNAVGKIGHGGGDALVGAAAASCSVRSRSVSERISSVGADAAAVGSTAMSEDRSVTEDSQFSSSV